MSGAHSRITARASSQGPGDVVDSRRRCGGEADQSNAIPRTDGSFPFTSTLYADDVNRIALAATLALPLVLLGCTPAPNAGSLPAPVSGTTPVRPGTLVAVKNPIPNTDVPVQSRLAPEVDRPGLAFQVLASRPGDRSLRIAWTDSGHPECGAVSAIWAYETTLQVVVTLYERPTLSAAEDTGCTAQGVIHIQEIPLTQPVADRIVSAFGGIPRFGAF